MTKKYCHHEKCVKEFGGINKNNNVSYALGYRFCRECVKYFKTELWRCPCCSNQLRCKPARGTQRELLVQEMRIKA